MADFEVQTTADSGNAAACAAGICNYQQSVYLGGFVGYDFGPVDIAVWAIDPVLANNTAQGLTVFTRVGFKLWGRASRPLVAKN